VRAASYADQGWAAGGSWGLPGSLARIPGDVTARKILEVNLSEVDTDQRNALHVQVPTAPRYGGGGGMVVDHDAPAGGKYGSRSRILSFFNWRQPSGGIGRFSTFGCWMAVRNAAHVFFWSTSDGNPITSCNNFGETGGGTRTKAGRNQTFGNRTAKIGVLAKTLVRGTQYGGQREIDTPVRRGLMPRAYMMVGVELKPRRADPAGDYSGSSGTGVLVEMWITKAKRRKAGSQSRLCEF